MGGGGEEGGKWETVDKGPRLSGRPETLPKNYLISLLTLLTTLT